MKTRLIFLILTFLAFASVQAKIRIFMNVDSTNFPADLKKNLAFHPWEKGFLDVTQAPYNASGDGVTDVTAALQLAIDHAYACNLVVFVPHGTYLVSDQLSCYLDPGPQLPNNPISSASQRKFGHIIHGSEKNGQWPIVKLKDGSTVTDNTLFVFKYFDVLTGIEDASRHYLGTLRNFEIDMGDNPSVSAVYNNGAQLCALQNLKIYGNFDKGISTLPGSGGYVSNIEIIGGKIGIYQDNFRPNPTLFNIRLTEQSECGLMVLDTRGSLTMAGFQIQSPPNPSPDYRAVRLENDLSPIELGARANLNLVDGSIDMNGSAPAVHNYQQDLVIRNVYFKASELIRSGTYSNYPDILTGKGDQWELLSEYVFASGLDMGSVYRNKINQRPGSNDFADYSDLIDSLPPAWLLTRHSWGALPSWEDSMLVDLVLDYGASPDQDTNDDAIHLQAAIDDISTPGHVNFGKTLFIPRGFYHIKSQVFIKSGVKIIGAGKNISVLMVAEDWLPSQAVSAIITEDLPEPGIILSDLAIVGNHPNPLAGQSLQKNITPFELCTGQSVIRDVQTSMRIIKWSDNVYKEPIFRISGSGGGKIYGLCIDEGTRGPAEEGYRLLKLHHTNSPVTFYQVSVEDASEELDGEQTVHMEIDSCADVSIFGFKYEKESELLHVNNTGNITIIGGSGNYGLKDSDDQAIITIKNTPNVYIANISRKIQEGEISGKYFLQDGDLFLSGDVPIVLYSKLNDTLPPTPDSLRLEFFVTETSLGYPVPAVQIYLGTDTLSTGQDGRAMINLEPGSYSYRINHPNFIELSDSIDLVQDTLVRIHLLVNSTSLARENQIYHLYPNPAGPLIKLEVNNSKPGRSELYITDLTGRNEMIVPFEIRSGLNQFEVDTSGLKPGLHLVSFMNRSSLIFKK